MRDIRIEAERISTNSTRTLNEQPAVRVASRKPLSLEFDLVGVDPSFANALRRIMIAEVPTMAIERVYVLNNTSIIPDEILAHRLGLIPILADPRMFEAKTDPDDSNDRNTIVFELKAKCESATLTVYSKSLIWVPQGDQASMFASLPIRPVHDDIILAKLSRGQELSMELHCEKNQGKVHAKWSPVATASYRLLPEITLHEPVTGEDARRLQASFPKGVIAIESRAGVDTAVVLDPRKDSASRECLRHPELADKVALGKKKNHYIFTVESTGILTPVEIVNEALSILIEKCCVLDRFLDNIVTPV